MDLSELKDIVLLGLSGLVAVLGLLDRINTGKAKDAQIELLKERIAKMQEDMMPESVLTQWKARIECAEKALEFAEERMGEKDKEQQKEIQKYKEQIKKFTTTVKGLTKIFQDGTAAEAKISSSNIYLEFLNSKSYANKYFKTSQYFLNLEPYKDQKDSENSDKKES